ncbi:MAG: hypothetical protein NZ822_01960 [Patescibacteria group bacterium]|nr:hypothetical protein [Patescibacteria group bacterium]
MECERRIIDYCPIKKHSSLIRGLISLSSYENNKLKDVVLIGKEKAFEIFIDFGYLIAQEMEKHNLLEKFKDFYLAPVPLSRNKLTQRGFNQSLILCQSIVKNNNLKIFNELEKIKETEDQARLSHQERLKNLKNAFRVKGSAPQKVILVDDIKTTGATLKECAMTLRKAGTKEVWALTILK